VARSGARKICPPGPRGRHEVVDPVTKRHAVGTSQRIFVFCQHAWIADDVHHVTKGKAHMAQQRNRSQRRRTVPDSLRPGSHSHARYQFLAQDLIKGSLNVGVGGLRNLTPACYLCGREAYILALQSASRTRVRPPATLPVSRAGSMFVNAFSNAWRRGDSPVRPKRDLSIPKTVAPVRALSNPRGAYAGSVTVNRFE